MRWSLQGPVGPYRRPAGHRVVAVPLLVTWPGEAPIAETFRGNCAKRHAPSFLGLFSLAATRARPTCIGPIERSLYWSLVPCANRLPKISTAKQRRERTGILAAQSVSPPGAGATRVPPQRPGSARVAGTWAAVAAAMPVTEPVPAVATALY